MAKTAKEVQLDVIKLLEGSDLAIACNGSIYRNGFRPTDSEAEDIIVTHTSGIPDQHQTGIVTINIYVQDIPVKDNDVTRKVENSSRTGTIEELAKSWMKDVLIPAKEYYFEIQQTIETVKSEERSEHFIVVTLHYELLNY